jgi:hypothetical protein
LVVEVRRLLAGLTQTELLDLTQFLIQQHQVHTQAVLLLWVVVTGALLTLMAAPVVLAVAVAIILKRAVLELLVKEMLVVNHLAQDILLVRVVVALELLV